MAEIAGVYAASHTPVMLNFPELIPDTDLAAVRGAYCDLGRRIGATGAEVLVVISDDHVHNFFLDNLPAFCIGAAESYATPIEAWLKAERRTLPGDPALSAYLISEAHEAGFDPAFSMQLTLDHGTLTPLELGSVNRSLRIVPILINCVQPPLPPMRRCLQWGHFLGSALRAYQGCQRVAVLATGGLSHDVGTPRMGMVNETFDREVLRLLGSGDEVALIDYCRDRVNEAGNGAEEVRAWLMAHGVMEKADFGVIYYKALRSWYCGIGLAEWSR